MVAVVGAAVEWVMQRRSRTHPADLWDSPSVRMGAVLYAALLYQSRSTPAGFPGYEEAGGYWSTPTDNAMRRVRELVGMDLVIA